MRSLDQYGLLEWIYGLPLVHGIKRARNVVIERAFRRIHPPGYENFLADHARLAGGTIALSIAYNTPWVVDLLIRTAKRNLIADALIVVDNSSKREARAEIERLCRTRGVAYVGLPRNPEWHPCRSHGLAMTWAYYNLVRPLTPRAFGFLDHDLFPLEPLDLAAQVATQPVYGRLNHSPWGWNLWAGYCFYDFAAVSSYPLDFNNDNPRKLDTGGRNFPALYRHLDQSRLHFAAYRKEMLSDPLDRRGRTVHLIDNSIHVSQAAFDARSSSKPDPSFFERIVRANEEGARIVDLQPAPGTAKLAAV